MIRTKEQTMVVLLLVVFVGMLEAQWYKKNTPLNVAFTYRISEDTGIVPDDGTVQFDEKVFDSTKSFNPNTVEFIAPGCGMYVFMLNIRSNKGKTCWVNIIKDGDSLATAFAESGLESQLGDTTFVTIYLEKRNTVWAKNHGYKGTVCTIDFYFSFAGFRLFGAISFFVTRQL